MGERVHTADDEQLVSKLVDELLAEHPPAETPEAEFLGAQFDLGLAYVHFPEGYGGLGLPRQLERLIGARLAEVHAPVPSGRSVGGLAAPTILTLGSEDQKRRYLRRMFTLEDIWCQLFSEPGAGSDIAGLSTRAVLDGDEWVVTGQKVWTTLAHVATHGLLLARTDPEADKHKGITYFVVDMRADGVEVRPLRQMTGDATFNEVYLTEVRIPDAERLGPVGEGWKGALVTLMNERSAFGKEASPERGSGPIATAVALWGERQDKTPALRDRLLRLCEEAEVNRLTSLRARVSQAAGTPGPEGSTGKLAYAELAKSIYDFCLDLMGPEGMLYDSYEMRRPNDASLIKNDIPPRLFLRSRANSIEGGTSEIMHNILGERVLGLPPDVRVDKGVAWSEVPRN